MAEPHLNFGLTLEEHELAKEVKNAMKSNNWKDCFMQLIVEEKKRRKI